MNKVKRALALLLCLVMVLAYVPVPGYAAGGATNASMVVSATEVNVGDTITVTVSYSNMKISSFGCTVVFDKDLLTCESVVGPYASYGPEYERYFFVTKANVPAMMATVTTDVVSTTDEANAIGQVGFTLVGTTDVAYAGQEIFTATFTAKAAGTVTLTLKEDSAGSDGFLGTAATQIITIGGSSEPDVPSCDHSSTKLVPNADGKTHNVVCTNEACNGYVVRTENCSGTDDGDHTTAVMCACGNTVTAATEHTYTQKLRGTLKSAGDCMNKAVYAVKCDYCDHESDTLTVEGEYGDHTYGDLIPAQEAVHTETELKGAVAAHYLCQCGKYFTEGKVETTLAALTGDAPEHTVDPSKTTTETTKEPTCTEGGTVVTETFCSCGYSFGKTTGTGTVDPNAHDWNTPTYSWSADGTTCTATRTCKHDAAHKEEETVDATPSVTTVGTCQIEEVVTYTANFDAEWAQDGQTYEVAGEKDPDNHVGNATISYRDNKNGTHTAVSTYECGHSVDGETLPCSDGNDADELCDSCGNDLHVCAENLTHVAAQDATCIETGIVEHWYCEHCDKYYSDDQATTEIDEDDTIVDIDPTNHAGEQCLGTASDPTLDLTHHGVYCDACGEIWDEENPDEPHVAGEDGYCKCGYFEFCIDFSGGKITTTPPEGMSQEVWDSLVESMIGSYEATEWCMFSTGFSKMTIEDGMFVKDGYNYVGLAYDKDGKQPYNGEDITKPTTLYLIWESTHVCAHDHYAYINNAEGHVSVCSCGEKLGYSEGHELGENDLCVCGAWLFTTDYNGGKCSENPGKDGNKYYFEPGLVYNFAWNEEGCKEVYAKEGYVFAGYAYDADGQNPVVNPTELSSTTTVYVAWACNHDETVHEYTYTDNRDGTHTVKCACGETIGEPAEHDYTTGDADHTCICGAVEKFTLSFDLNGGTLADEHNELEAYVQDGKFILPDIEYGASIEYNRFYQEGWLVKEGYHITGFEDEDGNFHSLESDDTFTMEGDTTLAVVWEVNTYTLTVNVRATGELVDLTVPYGANLLEVLAAAAEEGKIPALGKKIRVNNADQNGENLPYQYTYSVGEGDDLTWLAIDESFTMPAEDFAIDQDHNQNGWVFSDFGDGRVGAEYCDFEDGWLGSGWHYIEENYDDVEGGAWYYFQEGTGAWAGGWFFRVEGLTRVPYPTEPINGWTYEADADALAYDPSFIDKDEAWFLFDEEGKFQYDTNGDIGWYEINDANELRYMNHGMLEWHPGLIKNGDDYYYFIGDVVNGGNIAAEGDTWITKNNGEEDFAIGDIYNFAEGKLSGAHGIVDGKYYENSRLMAGNGLTKIQVEGETKFIYVRSNGYIVVNAEYYVPANDKGVVPGTYAFDENGYLINPELTGKDGIYWENGAWYYYENGKICYNKGLIEVTETWYDGEGTVETTAVIYVRSNGQLAMGYYYVTNMANYNGSVAIASGTKLLFDNYGAMAAAMNGIVDGKYYQNNQIVYGAGVVEIEEGKYIYVKSDGTVVMNRNYWITNVGDTDVVAKLYTFDENGYFTPEFVSDQKDGIVDGYYYENGAIAYGKGLTEYNGGLIYVRSNGQVATGKYWITTTNGLKESGYYTFGEDGMMIN